MFFINTNTRINPNTINVGQTKIKLKLTKYIEKYHKEEGSHLIKKLKKGHCSGFSVFWLYAISLYFQRQDQKALQENDLQSTTEPTSEKIAIEPKSDFKGATTKEEPEDVDDLKWFLMTIKKIIDWDGLSDLSDETQAEFHRFFNDWFFSKPGSIQC